MLKSSQSQKKVLILRQLCHQLGHARTQPGATALRSDLVPPRILTRPIVQSQRATAHPAHDESNTNTFNLHSASLAEQFSLSAFLWFLP